MKHSHTRTRKDLPRGVHLLQDPQYNKGTAFTKEERAALGLRGLLPPRVCEPEEQIKRVMENYRRNENDLDKFVFMTALHDRNEALYYRIVIDNLEELMPIIYTPVVGQACQHFGHIYRRARGMFVSLEDRGSIEDVLRCWPEPDVRVIVVTDGERILGLGDLGANGMGIPIGKLALYSACAGVDPTCTLPVTLDVGTENQELLDDPLYLGLSQHRVRGAEYDAFVDEFVHAANAVFPNVLIQFEDFANVNAFRLLRKYRNEVCTFNDDIQGTGAVTLAGLYSALRITKGALKDQTVLFMGAGEAGAGIADIVVSAMVDEGMPEADARGRCWFVDSKGLVVKSRDDLRPHKKPYAHDHAPLQDLREIVDDIKPTALIGVSGQPGVFTEPVVKAMGKINERPIVFALSNPTSKAECTAEQAYRWTDGRAIFASGSPFLPVDLDGRTIVPGQGNNAYIFPGVGLGVILAGAKRVTDEMFFVAAKTLAHEVSEADLERGCIYPSLPRIRKVSAAIASAVARVAYDRELATAPRPKDIESWVEGEMYEPRYENYLAGSR